MERIEHTFINRTDGTKGPVSAWRLVCELAEGNALTAYLTSYIRSQENAFVFGPRGFSRTPNQAVLRRDNSQVVSMKILGHLVRPELEVLVMNDL